MADNKNKSSGVVDSTRQIRESSSSTPRSADAWITKSDILNRSARVGVTEDSGVAGRYRAIAQKLLSPSVTNESPSVTTYAAQVQQLQESLDSSRRDTEMLKRIIKTSQSTSNKIVSEQERISKAVEDVDAKIKETAVKQIEVLGIFSSILALIITGAITAASSKSISISCFTMLNVFFIVVLLMICVDDIINRRSVFSSTKSYVLAFVLVVIVFGSIVFDRDYPFKNSMNSTITNSNNYIPNVLNSTNSSIQLN